MRKITVCCLLLPFLFLCSCANEDEEIDLLGNWTQISPIEGVARSAAVSFVIGDKAYVGTGYTSDERLTDFWEFDPVNSTWRQLANFGGTARNSAVAFSIGNKGYVGTGYDNTYRKDFWEYDLANNRWAQKTDFGGVARQMAVGFALRGGGYIGTGYSGNYVSDFWRFDPMDASNGYDSYGNPMGSWTQVASYGGKNPKRRGAVSFVLNDMAYVGTGESNGINQQDFFVYDAESNNWTEIAELEDDDENAHPRSYGVAFTLDGKGYVGTGVRSANLNDFWEYNPSANTWEQKTSFEGTARVNAVGFTVGNKGYIGTGSSSTYRFDDFWVFAPNDAYDEED
ncbi:kelch repeat-containing protein [Rhodocytophaga aerolata]|uniref:Kelch repeat-containing protein n=1 Tax=Rhodocytophaga aerolata TaxID=455078 RepID=A0ABT8RF04_9BACT|nr:kelch repeat-containing protein [Rhodocytophaga aerolata]MDO1450559.1 kelch repeat-containing protein [Rhodocytophaga aerolata]